ncbi:substrate-binding domain-containing protein [Actinoplanes sp. TFC3]|uniref:substrate-binding domain-containing protein n=1 Tax=Actinoplanes sp. TFC3 TaxID=1710355 RepID=UPI00082AE702|nr:GntR family transcriptional regulator [Actinoplanes sp. TFC3]
MDGQRGPDPAAGSRKFRLLADRLRRRIAGGDWPPGARLPTEPLLAAAHGVGIGTVRRAVGLLVAEGVVERRQGSGTYVLRVPMEAAGTRRVIGLLVPSTSYYYPQVIEGIRGELSATRTGFLVASSGYRPDRDLDQVADLLLRGADALVLVPNLHLVADPQRHVDALRAVPVPCVLVERQPPAPDDTTPCVATNHAGGVYAAVRHLAGLGHQRIGYLGRLRTGTSALITASFSRALAGFSLTPVPGATVCRESWTEQQLAALASVFRDRRVTALFCHGDHDAARLIRHARRLGLRVPHDLAVVAYDDEATGPDEPVLTSVSPPKAEVGRLAARMLLNLLDGGAAASAQRVALQPRLIVRQSCGAATR